MPCFKISYDFRTIQGFLPLDEGVVRSERIFTFSYVDLKSDSSTWITIESWQATDRRIRAISLFFEPDPLSYESLAIIDEIELWKRERDFVTVFKTFAAATRFPHTKHILVKSELKTFHSSHQYEIGIEIFLKVTVQIKMYWFKRWRFSFTLYI